MFYIVAIFCVIGIAVGQILFKMTSSILHKTGSFFSIETLLYLLSALSLYGITTIAWIWVLQKIDLGKAYPLMALAFILVPIGSFIFFNEKFTPQYFVGIFFIMIGIILAVRS